ncbi:hypothetical protein CMUS01_02479 [Colletotrichum musicola]|uniref:Uncharacterized protein n=1 Tax=Colletotrichum musicola TaxID=2175873 RepID=A0A8H6NUV1_9PEZI|nr:hypothetical protein CMUS01_02479 [Colletotrichum musicola]
MASFSSFYPTLLNASLTKFNPGVRDESPAGPAARVLGLLAAATPAGWRQGNPPHPPCPPVTSLQYFSGPQADPTCLCFFMGTWHTNGLIPHR